MLCRLIGSLFLMMSAYQGLAHGEEQITKAVAIIHPTDGNEVTGVVTFTKVNGGIKIVADLEGLSPGEHGFHIHEFGDCTAKDAASAGGHFNPDNRRHGCPDKGEHHVGDLGNIVADQSGNAHYDKVNKSVAFSGSKSVIGRAVIIHSGKDDCVSQPSGDAGDRIGCGVIGIAK